MFLTFDGYTYHDISNGWRWTARFVEERGILFDFFLLDSVDEEDQTSLGSFSSKDWLPVGFQHRQRTITAAYHAADKLATWRDGLKNSIRDELCRDGALCLHFERFSYLYSDAVSKSSTGISDKIAKLLKE